MARARAAALVFATLAVGCASSAGARAPAVTATTSDPSASAAVDEASRVQALRDDEQLALETIAATDSRFARRLGGAPDADQTRGAAVKALLADDPDAMVIDGTLDFFSFNARARGLDDASSVAVRAPAPIRDDAPSGSPIARPRLERELLERTVGEERARLVEERDLPRGASALVRGIVETWAAPRDEGHAEARDAWLVRRLDEVRASLGGAKLSRTALLELDDALDPLERLAAPAEYPETAKALARIRVALGNTAPAGDDAASWGRLATALRAHLGLTLSPTELRARLDRAERALRAEAVARLARAGMDERAIAKKAAEVVLAAGACGAEPGASRVRALAPPSERAAICGGVRAMRDASDDATRAAIVVALHDEAVIAQWSLAIHEAHVAPDRATQAAHPFFGAPPEREAKWLRFAAARPVAAIGAGLAAELLARDPGASARWFAFGDAPLDVVERELFAGAATSPPPRASLRP